MGINPAPIPLAYGAWQPDVAPHQSSALTECINVLPLAGSYAPFPAFDPVSGVTFADPVTGLFSLATAEGTPAIYAGTANKIYRVNQGSLDTAYNNPDLAEARWQFTSFDDRVIAVNPNANPQGAEPGLSFTDLGGSPPRANVVAVVGDHLVIGNLVNDGVDGSRPNRIRWSGFNNPDTWGTDIATGADFEEMPFEGGPVVAVTGRETGTIFQRKLISRMTLSGSASTVFNITAVEQNRGALSTGAVCNVGNLVYFIADDGFFVWDGTAATPLGGGFDAWFKETVEPTAYDAIVSAFDPVTRCVLWAFPEVGHTSPSKLLAWSLGDRRPSLIDYAVQQITSAETLPTTLEDMPIPDDYPGSFDDAQFKGGLGVMAAVDSLGRYGNFGGSPMAATLTTGDYQSKAGQRAFVNSVRPISDAMGAQISIGLRSESDANVVSFTAPTSRGVDGACPQRADARLMRFRKTTVAGETWRRASGLELNMRATGRR